MSNIITIIKKIFNTFLTPRYYKIYLKINKKIKNKNRFFNIFSKLWFLPSVQNLQYWHKVKNIDERHGIKHYSRFTGGSKELIFEIKKYCRKNYKILDIGCNVGRYLNYLSDRSYNNLYGVDINREAISYAKKNKKLNLKCSSIENYLLQKKNNYFDITYTHGATIELIKPTFNIISEISRVTKLYTIFLISENGHAYPRFWRYEFTKHNYNIVSVERIIKKKTDYGSLIILKKNKICI
jgi:SAM-dependent methyltransferase